MGGQDCHDRGTKPFAVRSDDRDNVPSVRCNVYRPGTGCSCRARMLTEYSLERWFEYPRAAA
jgi:hypothetical protein